MAKNFYKTLSTSIFASICLGLLFILFTLTASAQSVTPVSTTTPPYSGSEKSGTSALAAISVRSPNGGEVWERGNAEPYLISWTSQIFVNTLLPPTVKIEWVRSNSTESGLIVNEAPALSSGGTFSWNIPADFAPGKYRIRITLFDAVDISDGEFTVPGVYVSPASVTIQAGEMTSVIATVFTYTGTSHHNVDDNPIGLGDTYTAPERARVAVIDKLQQINTQTGEIRIFGITAGSNLTMPTIKIYSKLESLSPAEVKINFSNLAHGNLTIEGVFPYFNYTRRDGTVVLTGLGYAGCPGENAALSGKSLNKITQATVDGINAEILSKWVTYDIPNVDSTIVIKIPYGIQYETTAEIRLSGTDLRGQPATTSPSYFRTWSSGVCEALLPMPTSTPPIPIPMTTPTPIPTPTQPAPPSILTITLRYGMKHEQVKILQQILSEDKTIYPEGLVTGYFGYLTHRAIQRFQIKYNIVSSGNEYTTGYGQVGPKTRAHLNVLNQ